MEWQMAFIFQLLIAVGPSDQQVANPSNKFADYCSTSTNSDTHFQYSSVESWWNICKLWRGPFEAVVDICMVGWFSDRLSPIILRSTIHNSYRNKHCKLPINPLSGFVSCESSCFWSYIRFIAIILRHSFSKFSP